MPSALIGYTGFVGSNLLKQTHFDDLYNSKNIADIHGKEYDLVVCAAPRADKWWANQNAEDDKANVDSLAENLLDVRAERFIHISTIDVYDDPIGVVEYSPIDESKQTPYGHNRWLLENTVQAIFPHAQILRLPGLFGPGLKKNFIYDILHNDYRFLPNPYSTFQFLDIGLLQTIIDEALEVEYPLWNIACEPVTVLRVAEALGRILSELPINHLPEVYYDVRTKYLGPYLFDANWTLAGIKDFADHETLPL